MMPVAERFEIHRRGEPPILYFGTPVVLISFTNEDGSTNLAPMSSVFWLEGARECVLNLPSERQADAVDRVALATGSDPMRAPRVAECPVQLEAVDAAWRDLAAEGSAVRGRSVIFELRIQRVHLAPAILMTGNPDRIDPDKWRPLIMSFQKYYGLAPRELRPSALARVPERFYRSPDIERARVVRLAS